MIQFKEKMKMQQTNLSLLKPENKYNTKVLHLNGMCMGVLISYDNKGNYRKSAYYKLDNKNTINYIGSQLNDDNSKVYPYDKYSKKMLQDILWEVCSKGENI